MSGSTNGSLTGPTTGPRNGRFSPRSGITLLELVAALLIISIAVGIAVPAYLSLGNQDDLTRATQRVGTLFRLARDSAISSGLPVTVVIDSVTELVWIDTPRRIQLGSQDLPEEEYSLYEEVDSIANLALLGGDEAWEALEPGQALGLPEGVHMELPRARARFTFEPTGAALADTLLLTGVFGVRAVVIDAWTGDVKVY